MRQSSKKLTLAKQTLRTLSHSDLANAGGAGAGDPIVISNPVAPSQPKCASWLGESGWILCTFTNGDTFVPREVK